MDLNKNILQKSIQELPKYTPTESLWERIDAALDAEASEVNPETLQKAIKAMRNYNAPLSVWEKLETCLPTDTDAVLRAAIKQLPTHDAPPQLWLGISEALDAPVVMLKVVKKSYLRYAVAAASVGVVLACSLWFLNKSSRASDIVQLENVSYTQELAILPTEVEKVAAIAHDKDIEKVNKFCEKQVVVCEKPDFQALKSELEELTEAKKELQEAIGEFNTDQNLVAQLSSIEEERGEILKKLMTKI